MDKNYIPNLWKRIVSELYSKPIEMQTMGRGRWFSVYSKDNNIYIDNSQTNKRSVKLNGTRKINETEFSKIYPYYPLWRKGKKGLRGFMQKLSLNTSYILALINRFEKEV